LFRVLLQVKKQSFRIIEAYGEEVAKLNKTYALKGLKSEFGEKVVLKGDIDSKCILSESIYK
jgi:hypothetical protein